MNKKELIESLLFSGFRIMAVGLVLVGALSLLFRFMDSWYRFDPNYLGTFLLETVVRPVILIVAGAGLYGCSGKLAGRMSDRF